ncbi:TPA: hypothetical protein ACMWS1_000572, partial [Neisseria gonorrhoeae]
MPQPRRRGGCFFPHASDYGVSGGLFRKKILIKSLDCRVRHRRYEQAQYRQSYDECRLPDKNRTDCPLLSTSNRAFFCPFLRIRTMEDKEGMKKAVAGVMTEAPADGRKPATASNLPPPLSN